MKAEAVHSDGYVGWGRPAGGEGNAVEQGIRVPDQRLDIEGKGINRSVACGKISRKTRGEEAPGVAGGNRGPTKVEAVDALEVGIDESQRKRI